MDKHNGIFKPVIRHKNHLSKIKISFSKKMADYLDIADKTTKVIKQFKEMVGYKENSSEEKNDSDKGTIHIDNLNVKVEPGAIQINNYYGKDFAGLDSDENNQITGTGHKAIGN